MDLTHSLIVLLIAPSLAAKRACGNIVVYLRLSFVQHAADRMLHCMSGNLPVSSCSSNAVMCACATCTSRQGISQCRSLARSAVHWALLVVLSFLVCGRRAASLSVSSMYANASSVYEEKGSCELRAVCGRVLVSAFASVSTSERISSVAILAQDLCGERSWAPRPFSPSPGALRGQPPGGRLAP